MKIKHILKKIIIISIWLMIWQAASMMTGLELLFASPVCVLKELLVLMGTGEFYIVIMHSFLRITCGFLLSFIIAVFLGCLAGRYQMVQDFLAPAIHLMKSLPVAACIIIILMWFGSAQVSMIVGGMVVIPIVYTSVVQGIHHLNRQMNEMADVFHMNLARRVRYIYFPQIYPYVESNCRVALGMCWKAGVSAEVIGLAKYSIGSEMYYAKLYLLSADLFAWSIVVILLSMLFENVFLWILRLLQRSLAK